MPGAVTSRVVQLPWFRRRPRATIAAAFLLYAAVLTLRLSVHGTSEAVSLLFCLPIALAAVAFGFAGGLLAGLLSVGGVLTWVMLHSVEMSPLAWVTRVLPLLLLGVLLGDATDRLQAAEAGQRSLEAAAQRQSEAAELNDTIVQGLAAAKWALEAGQLERGLQVVSETLELAQEHVSQLLRAADTTGTGGRVRRMPFERRRAGQDEPDDGDLAQPAAPPTGTVGDVTG